MCLGSWKAVKFGAPVREAVQKLVRCQCGGVRLGMLALLWLEIDR